MGRALCETTGCVDEFGSSLVPPPDVPGQLTREDRRWIRRQNAVADELARVSAKLFGAQP